MTEGMGDGAIDGQLCPYPDAAHHEPDLVNETVSKYPPDVIFKDRIKNRHGRHEGPDPYQ
jgi:hypothetical protein